MLFTLFGISAGLVLVLLLANRVPLSYTFRNLTVRWLTSLLTVLAFMLVIGLMVVMLAFTTGMQRMTEGTGEPSNVMILADSADDEAFSSLDVGDAAEIENLPEVLRDGEPKRAVASRETFLIVNQPVVHPKPGRPRGRFLQVRGVVDVAMAARVHNLELQPGGVWFSEAGKQQLPDAGAKTPPAIQAVLGEGVAQELAADRTPEEAAAAKNRKRLDVGDRFVLGRETCIVTGIMKSSGSTYNSEIWAKQSAVAPTFGKDTLTTLVLRTADADAAIKLRDFLKNNYKKASVTAKVEREYYANLSDTNNQFLFAIMIVTGIMAVGGVFGVMNTMFAAISNRIKDIGVLRLLGYKRRHILVSFLLESLVIALIGGLLGCAIGSLANGVTANSIIAGGSGGKFVVLELVVDARIWAAGMLLTLLMGVFGGLLPALSAVRLRPLDALR